MLLLVSFVCLSTWIIGYKLQAGRWRFELFTIDFSIGAVLLSLCAALALGNASSDLPFNDRLLVSSKTSQAMVVVAGGLFGFGNTMLLGAGSLLGVASAFGISGGLALSIGVALSRRSAADSTAAWVIAAAFFVIAAILSASASRVGDEKAAPAPKGQPPGPIRLRRSTRGIMVATIGGLAISFSYPLCLRGTFDEFGLGPYAGTFLFCLGMLIANLVFSLYFFNIAIDGAAIPLRTYLKDWPGRHLPGLASGAIWAIGGLTVLLGDTANVPDSRRTAASALPAASIVVVMCLGILVWREFRNTPKISSVLIGVALISVLAGIGTLALGVF